MSHRPLLAVSMGDPVGVGPEITVKAASVNDVRAEADIVVFGDPGVLARAGRDIPTVPMTVVEVTSVEEARAYAAPDVLPVFPVTRLALDEHRWGAPTRGSDRAQLEFIHRAFEAVHDGRADALVTAPISKASISRAGAKWAGHTEMLAELCGVEHPVMLLAGPTLRVVPLTTHLPLSEVPGRLSRSLVEHTIRVTNTVFRQHFGRHRPRIGVAGLNPHAGEGGLFGTEEREIIRPAIEAARRDGIEVSGPFSGDTVFHRALGGEFDVVIGMYHDQALIPIKLLDFDRAVNVTMGLPIIRTSVDHGTAYDIAGRGVASASSLIAALCLAAQMVRDGRPAARADSRGDLGADRPVSA